MYQIEHQELLSIINKAARAAALETVELFKKYGELISKADIIREIGISLYTQGVENGKIHPFRNDNSIKGKIWIKTSEYLKYKQSILDKR
jgi:hypothetical protein